MIYPDDAKGFSELMDVVWQSLGRTPLQKQTKRYWFDKLIHLSTGEVSNLFDQWLMREKELPTVNDILNLSRPREFHKALPAPRSEEVMREGLERVAKTVAEGMKPKRDHKAWARRILESSKLYPDISVRFAKEALNIND